MVICSSWFMYCYLHPMATYIVSHPPFPNNSIIIPLTLVMMVSVLYIYIYIYILLVLLAVSSPPQLSLHEIFTPMYCIITQLWWLM